MTKINSGEVLSKLKSTAFRATSVFTHEFSNLHSTLLSYCLSECTFKREGTLYLACNDIKAFVLTSSDQTRYNLW